MRNTIKLAVVAALALGATSVFATNGDIMIGQGAQSRSMGGVAIAKSFGAVSGLANPAAINSVKSMEVEGALTAFMPSVSFKSDAATVAQGYPAPSSADSTANFSVIPELAFAQRLTDRLVYGISVTGTAGMGTDYDGVAFGTTTDNGAFRMKTALSLAKVAIPISYNINGGLTIGVTAIMQYGSLKMSHMRQTSAPGTTPVTYGLLDNGEATDINYGLEFGATYDLTNIGVAGLTLGVVYKQDIDMTYDKTISSSVNAFGGATQTGITSGDSLHQPAERGVGFSYTNTGSTLAFDYKVIEWGNAVGYKDFGWENQDVYAVGYEYASSGWAIRVGYNYAKNPIVEQNANPMTAGQAAYSGAVKNFFNMSGFPAVVETHYTVGAGYDITNDFTLDGSFIYAPEVTDSYDTTGMTAAFVQGAGGTWNPSQTSTAEVKHSQMAVTLGGSYRF